jgi:tetratricopeptide (TPR) repeat protein
MMVVLIVILMLPILRPDQVQAPAGAGGAPAAAAAGGALDIANMSPREAADRLFNRVMTAVSQGNIDEAQQFLPMAIQSYDMARPLDQDGLFHLSLLHQQLPDFPAALRVAQEALAENPDHLLNLSAAGQAAIGTGDTAAAVEFFQHFLDVYEVESQKPLPEYQAHGNMLPEMKAEAERNVGG